LPAYGTAFDALGKSWDAHPESSRARLSNREPEKLTERELEGEREPGRIFLEDAGLVIGFENNLLH
jgi:hypothetical protein